MPSGSGCAKGVWPIPTARQSAAPQQPLTLGAVWRLFYPLSLSDVIMVLAGPILAAGLVRLANPEASLAAYSVAEALAILIEAPIIMILHASTALARNRHSFRLLTRLMWTLSIGLTALHALLAFTPLSPWLFGDVLDQPPDVVAAVGPAFQAMLLWTWAIAYRRLYQGLLIWQRKSHWVSYAAYARLASLAITVVAGVVIVMPGSLVAGLALGISVVVEAVVVGLFARRLLKQRDPWADSDGADPDPGLPLTMGALWRFYVPLAMAPVLVWIGRPLLNKGVANAPLAELSLAAWPVAWTTVALVANATRMTQQMFISLLRDSQSYAVLRRFTWLVGGGASVLLALASVTPLAPLYLERVIGLSGPIAATVLPALQVSVLHPLFVSQQQQFQGLLIREGRTTTINLAAVCGTGAMVASLYLSIRVLPLTGVLQAALAMQLGIMVELAVLYGATRPLHRRWLAS